MTGLDADGWLEALLDARTSDGEGPAPIATPPDFAGSLRPYQERGLGWLALPRPLGLRRLPRRRHGPRQDGAGPGARSSPSSRTCRRPSARPDAARLPDVRGRQLAARGRALHARPARSTSTTGPSGSAARTSRPPCRDIDLVISTYALLHARSRGHSAASSGGASSSTRRRTIKNSDTRAGRAARAIRAPSRFALTGTPVENQLASCGRSWSS